MVAVLRGQISHIRGNLFLTHILTQIVIEDECLHLDQIDDASEVFFRADRQLDGNRVTLEAIVHHLQDIEEIGTHHVHLVDIDKTRDMIFVSLSPYSLGLRFHAAFGAEHCHRPIKHAQGAFDLNSEVDVARRVNNIDTSSLPEAGGCSGRDRDATFLLLRHPVHRSSAFMGLTKSVVDTGVEQDTLSRRGLACIDVSHDANISRILK